MTLAQNSFLYSANADFIAELFQRYAADPSSVDVSWRGFFDGLHQDARSALSEITGASWAPSKAAKIIANENETEKKAPRTSEASPATLPVSQQAILDSIRAIMLIRVYRVRGHLQAQLDPLGLAPRITTSELDPKSYGFTEDDYYRPIFLNGTLGFENATLHEIMARLQATYSGSVGVEFMHIQDSEEKIWIQERMELAQHNAVYSSGAKRDFLKRLTAADGFEKFLATKFVGVKRFGLEGAEAMIPALEAAIARGATQGLREVVVGMAHRGRLNVLTNLLSKPFTAMFSEFQGTPAYSDSFQGSGDVKYHMGTLTDRDFNGHSVHLTMNANPSHLEWVNPVVTGRVRAKQQQRSGSQSVSEESMRQVMALLIHGDAAFAGQGIVAETLMLSALKGYSTGGTLHFVINNQVGFTTSAAIIRVRAFIAPMSPRCIQAPIFHVNGDDVEGGRACLANMAAEFRQKFQQGRRHRHGLLSPPRP